MMFKRRNGHNQKAPVKNEGDQDQGLPLNPSNADFFFEGVPSGGMLQPSICPTDELAVPNDSPGLSGKLKSCEEEVGFENGLIMDGGDGIEFTDLVADDEAKEKEDDDEVGAPHDGIVSSGSPSACIVGRGVCMAYASSNSLVKEFVVIGVVLASGLA
jgi:hypothetical protein